MILRRVPGCYWVRVVPTRRAEPGNGWMYAGLVYRLALTVRGVGVVVMVMPRRRG